MAEADAAGAARLNRSVRRENHYHFCHWNFGYCGRLALGPRKRYSIIRPLILPQYDSVLKGLTILNQAKGELTVSDPGFAEISKFVMSTRTGDVSIQPIFTKFSIKATGFSFAKDPKSTTTLIIKMENHPPVEAKFSDFHDRVKSAYSDSLIMKYDVPIFFAGIIVSILAFIFDRLQ